MFDGQVLPPHQAHTDTTWGYIHFNFDHTIYYRPQIEAYIYGTGRRLSFSIEEDLSQAIPELRLDIADIEYIETMKLQAAQRERQLIFEAEQRKIREAQVQERIREEQAAIRRHQYLEALKYIFMLAMLTVGAGIAVWLVWVSRSRPQHLPKHLSAKPVTKSRTTRGLPEKTRS